MIAGLHLCFSCSPSLYIWCVGVLTAIFWTRAILISWYVCWGNPSRYVSSTVLCARLIENKCESLGIALRDMRLGVDIAGLHGNSDRPAYYASWLCVSDAALPVKGTGHRRNTHDETPKNASICSFTSSDLWRLCGFASVNPFPKALAESEFHVPSSRAHLTSNDSRRNLTDPQETSQWFSGEAIWSTVFSGLWSPLFELVGFAPPPAPQDKKDQVYFMIGNFFS